MIQHEGQRQGAVCVYVPVHAGGGRKWLQHSSVAQQKQNSFKKSCTSELHMQSFGFFISPFKIDDPEGRELKQNKTKTQQNPTKP